MIMTQMNIITALYQMLVIYGIVPYRNRLIEIEREHWT